MITVTNLHKSFRLPVAAPEGPFRGFRTMLSRQHAMKHAVSGVNFTIEPGEFVGYIGPNGAGKSTTIKMLSGILHPTSGEVRIDGLNPHRDRRRVARRLGVLFGQRSQLWWDLPVRDSYDILAAMYGLAPAVKAARMQELTELLQLDEYIDTPVRKLSLGQRMRADLAAALLHDPDILFLDEPTIGLDVIAKRSIREYLRNINVAMGKTILLTTHDMDDIEQLCSRVIVINQGTLGFDGTIKELRRRIGLPTVIRVTYRQKPALPESLTSSHQSIHTNHHPSSHTQSTASSHSAESAGPIVEASALHLLAFEDCTVTIACNRNELSAMDALRLLEQYGEIEDVHLDEPNFEDIIHTIY
ncbi:ABC transporter related protein [Paenibacillus curdlanolyticus YK9]|uniref:ABC transporter related protein n=1 Tax=Paenibacillus curdlanolyticus YK9 TaxID=717606 RepID=E0IB48_9BACL|nr:ATP-binding cassette domain-containing protein [Paenibacillus curdlanolyticus]EFM10339.1 ABC transporter related protein [Paenibacillus curdlanolyticus YK9]